MISLVKSCFGIWSGKEDGRCTCFPNGDWVCCCRKHDYDCADAKRDYLKLKKADIELCRCVLGKGHVFIGVVMLLGVRGFHTWSRFLSRDW